MARGNRKRKSGVKTKTKNTEKFENQARHHNASINDPGEFKDRDVERQWEFNAWVMADIKAVIDDLIDQVTSSKCDSMNGADSNTTMPIFISLPQYDSRRESEPIVALSHREKLKIYKSIRKNKDIIPENIVDADGLKRLFQMATTSMAMSSKEPTINDLLALLESKGIWLSDPRLEETLQIIQKESEKGNTTLNEDVFVR